MIEIITEDYAVVSLVLCGCLFILLAWAEDKGWCRRKKGGKR